MTADRLEAAVDRYLQAAGRNVAPPPLLSDQLVDGETPTEQLLRVLGLAANSGDPADTQESVDGHAQREAWAAEAAGTFAEQDGGAAGQLGTVMSIAGMVGGAVAGLLAPVGQIPGQLAQGAQQAVQAAASLWNAPAAATSPADNTDDAGADSVEFGDAVGDGAAPETTGPGNGETPTAPTAVLGPTPVPPAATYPSAAAVIPPAQVRVAAPPAIASPAMTGMPMVPPGSLPNTGTDSKADTKRVATPAVRNGAPVQGRITAPATGPTVIDGKPLAARRIRADATPEEPR